jgi:glucose-6-phosphate 1-dehydrogenase
MSNLIDQMANAELPLTIAVIGASGDLARKKIFPALFALHCQRFLPEQFHVFGFARSPMSDESFREHIKEHLTCRYAPGASCADLMEQFLSRCSYASGAYDSREAFLGLYERMRPLEGPGHVNRMFYMAIPPFLFLEVARAIGGAGLVDCDSAPGWSRAVIEKPFGSDRATSDELVINMQQVFHEDQTFRIDHYLGKEIVQDLLILRFANSVFSRLWNRECIESVRIDWKEDIGVGERGGYFDSYGIVRDVMQNHLVQILALIAMEPPARFDEDGIRDEKVRVLRGVRPLRLENTVLGQYRAATCNGVAYPSYVDERGIADDSRTPTFAAAAFEIDNERWKGVPFYVSAGKGLDERLTEIRMRFRRTRDQALFAAQDALAANELVIRVQPDENIRLRIINTRPGLETTLGETALDLRYSSAFHALIPDAYECLLLDVIQGERSLFIRGDVLAAAWDIFTPVLHEIEKKAIVPEPYDFGTRGPSGAKALASKWGV